MKRESRRFAHSLAGQMVTMVASILLLAMGTNAYLQYLDEVAMVERTINTRGQSLGDILATASIEPLLVYDVVTIDNHIYNATQQKQVVYAAAIAPDSNPLAVHLDHDNAFIQQALIATGSDDESTIIEALHDVRSILHHRVPVTFNGETLAEIVLGLDRSEYTAASSAKFKQKVIFTLLIGLGVGIGFFLVFRHKVLQPIHRLAEGAYRITRSDFGRELEAKGNNELSDLSEDFNRMARHLEQMIGARDEALEELETLNTSLEEHVHERTRELQDLNAEMAHQALHDPLTNLPNRTLLVERLQQNILAAKRHNTRLAFLMLDLNNFKEVNDTLGHPEGDRLLRDVAARLPSALRESDTVGRLGGDEFGIVLPEVDISQAETVARKVMASLAPSFSLNDQAVAVGASIGIAMYPDHGEDHTALIRHADVAMYQAKRGEGKPVFYDPEADKYTTQRLALMADLHQAIDKNQLELHYQPQVDLKLKKVIGVEALLRWTHPEHGIVPPAQFIPMAETSNLISLLSDWVLSTAIAQLGQWQKDKIDLRMSINLSARDLLNPDLPQQIGQHCQASGASADGLTIEITESVIMSNPEQAIEILSHPLLKTLRYAIDDFGTGYSSLSYLKRLPVAEVKIDRGFVMDMANDEEDASIVRSVIDLTHNLGHQVVAEGVENEQALAMLSDLGCDLAQGFHFSKAVPITELETTITRIEAIMNGAHILRMHDI